MTCQECQELLPLYLTGSLDPAEKAAVRAHLATGCAPCAADLAATEVTLHKIPLGLPLQAAPASAWEKLETRMALKEQAEGPAPDRTMLVPPVSTSRPSPMSWLGWAAAAMVAITLGTAWYSASKENDRTHAELARLTTLADKANGLELRIVELERLTQTLTEQNVTQLAINMNLSNELRQKIETLLQSDQYAVASPEQPTSSGKLYWNKKSQTWQIYLDGVKPAGAGKTYELWVVTEKDKLAAGTAQVDDKGRLVFETGKLPDVQIVAAAITDEREGGEPDNSPKGAIQFLAKLTN